MRSSAGLSRYLAAQIILWFCGTLAAETIVFTHGGPQSILVGYRVYVNGVLTGGDRYLNTQGQTENFVFGNTAGAIEVRLFRSGTTTISPPTVIASFGGSNGASTHSVTVYSDGSYGGPAQVFKLKTKTTNNTGYPVFYDIYKNGVKIGTSPPVPPGTDFEFYYEDTAKADISFKRYRYDWEGNPTDVTYSRTIGTNDPNWYTGEGVPPTSNTGSDTRTDVPLANPELNNLGFTDTSDLAKEATLRRVGEVLYDSQQQGFAAVANEVRGVKGAVNGGLDAVRSAVAGVGGKVDALGSKLDVANGHLGNAVGGINGINSNLGDVKTGINSVNSNIQQGNGKLDTIINRLEAANIHQTGIKSSIDAGNVTLASIEGKLVNVDLRLAEGNQHLATIQDNTQRTKEAVQNQTSNDNANTGQIVDAVTRVKDAVQNQTANDNLNHGESKNLLTQIKDKIAEFMGRNREDLDKVKNAVDANTQSTSNQLQKIYGALTNEPPEHSLTEQVSRGAAAAAPGKAVFDNLAANTVSPEPIAISGITDPWRITFGAQYQGGPWTINCDPRAYPLVTGMAAKIKAIIAALIGVLYCWSLWKVMENYVRTVVIVPQARSSGQALLGTNKNLILALVAAGGIVLAITAVPIAAASYYESKGGLTMFADLAVAFAGGSTPFLMAMQVVDMFIPLTTIIGLLSSFMTVKFAIGGIFWLAAVAVRFLVG